MKIVEGIIGYCRHVASHIADSEEPHSFAAICELSIRFWQACWSRRDMFVDGHQLEKVVPGLAKNLRLTLRDALHSYILMKILIRGWALSDLASAIELNIIHAVRIMAVNLKATNIFEA